MRLPTITQYLESVSNPEGLFRTLGSPEVERDCYRRIKMYAGRRAVIFKIINLGDKPRMMKCFLQSSQYGQEICPYICEHAQDDPLLAQISHLRQEIYVFDDNGRGEYYDLILRDWIEGETLENALRKAALAADRETLAQLAGNFDRMARELLQREWAHGDLKPENIIVGPDMHMSLIDYDAMFIPRLAGRRTSEIGTTQYQHPARDGAMFDKSIDNYSIAMISVSLHALARDPSLYAAYNSSDNIILNPAEILADRSPLWEKLLAQWKTAGERQLYLLTKMLRSTDPRLPRLPAVMLYSPPRDVPRPGEMIPVMQDGRWGYSGPGGDIVIIPQYDHAMDFTESLAAVNFAGVWYFIDCNNRIVINCVQFDAVKPFHEGLAAVKLNGSWGYIDTRGTMVIPPCFSIACHMCEGLAAVKFGTAYGYIDRQGLWTIEPRFEMAYNFRNGHASVQIDKTLRTIDRNGNLR